jgi:hypothetical protein
MALTRHLESIHVYDTLKGSDHFLFHSCGILIHNYGEIFTLTLKNFFISLFYTPFFNFFHLLLPFFR